MSQYNIRLIEKFEVAKDTLGFRFEKPEGFDFLPGQSVVLQVPWSKPSESFPKQTDAMRDMTIAASPTDSDLDFVIRQGRSDYKKALTDLQPGDEVVIFGPKGKFVFKTSTKPIVMLAGGIGITPFISILRYIKDKNLSQGIVLIYSNPTPERIAFREEITEIKKSQKSRNHKFEIIHTLTEKAPENWNGETGRIDADMIKKYVADLNNKVFYICGSSSMAADIKRIVSNLGVRQEYLKKEEFTGY
jgi:glycine betaine catabolism B